MTEEERLSRAIALRENGDYVEAQAILSELHTQDPNDAQVNYQLGWVHDAQGLEREAIPFYEAAIANGLAGDDLRGALLGLGSTYRCLGQYAAAEATLRRGMEQFPDADEFPVFLAMALYNLGQHAQAMSLLLRQLAETGQSAGIQRFQRAILFYHDKLDETW